MHTISVIIPCFNEEEALPVYYEAMTKVMEQWIWQNSNCYL